MTAGERPIGDDDLQALIDGRLAPERRDAVDAFLAGRPEIAAQLEADAEIRSMLRARLAFKAEEPIPARLRIANLPARRWPGRPRSLARMARAACWFLVGGLAGWLASGLPQRGEAAPRATQAAITAHRTFVVERLHPVEVEAAQEAHLVQWLSRRLGKPLAAPDLTAQGFRLMGGRLLPAGSTPAALFMYDDGQGTRLTLYARPGDTSDQTAFRFEQSEDVSAFSWRERGLSYVVTAHADRGRLLGVAEAIEGQLRAEAPSAPARL